jgi:hypothetical protein
MSMLSAPAEAVGQGFQPMLVDAQNSLRPSEWPWEAAPTKPDLTPCHQP